MVQALVTLDENTNRVLNVIKATYELKDKGAAIDFIVSHYIDDDGNPALKPTFLAKMKKAAQTQREKIRDRLRR